MDDLSNSLTQHKLMFQWIARDTRKRQKKVSATDYFLENDIEHIPFICDYICDYVFRNHQCNCHYCPVKWPQSSNTHYKSPCMNSVYGQWLLETDWQKAALLAEELTKLGGV